MHHHGGQEYVYTGNLGRLRIGTHRKHIFAERSLVPDKPHNRQHNQRIDHIIGNALPADLRQDRTFYKVGIFVRQTGDRLSVVPVGHIVQQAGAVYDQLCRQCYDKWVQLEFRYEESVYQTHDTADQHSQQNYRDDRHLAHIRVKFVDIGSRL